MTAKILQWIGKKKSPEFREYELLVHDPVGGPHKEMKLKVNPCMQLIDSDSIPVIYLNNMDITETIQGVISCGIGMHQFEHPAVDCAYILTDTGSIFMRGIKRFGDAPNGYSGSDLPIWHLQRAADINCPTAHEDLKEHARRCMGELKNYCNYVYDTDTRAYDFNAGLIV